MAQMQSHYCDKCVDKETRVVFDRTISILIGKKYGLIKEEIVDKTEVERAVRQACNNKSYPFMIKKLDKTWDTTMIVVGEIMVRGFWRSQPCGVGRTQRKQIYIEPFKRNGYKRYARKLKEYANAA